MKIVLNPGPPTPRPCSNVTNYNFDYQRSYTLKTPCITHPGDTIGVTCTYDPTLRQELPQLRKLPPRFVTWGDGSSDEMCLALVQTVSATASSYYGPHRDLARDLATAVGRDGQSPGPAAEDHVGHCHRDVAASWSAGPRIGPAGRWCPPAEPSSPCGPPPSRRWSGRPPGPGRRGPRLAQGGGQGVEVRLGLEPSSTAPCTDSPDRCRRRVAVRCSCSGDRPRSAWTPEAVSPSAESISFGASWAHTMHRDGGRRAHRPAPGAGSRGGARRRRPSHPSGAHHQAQHRQDQAATLCLDRARGEGTSAGR